eukprot:jgi/Ulvmu1/833/UM010_0207.1
MMHVQHPHNNEAMQNMAVTGQCMNMRVVYLPLQQSDGSHNRVNMCCGPSMCYTVIDLGLRLQACAICDKSYTSGRHKQTPNLKSCTTFTRLRDERTQGMADKADEETASSAVRERHCHGRYCYQIAYYNSSTMTELSCLQAVPTATQDRSDFEVFGCSPVPIVYLCLLTVGTTGVGVCITALPYP